MKYKQFKKCLQDLDTFREEQYALGKQMRGLGRVEVDFGDKLFESYVRLLSDLMGEEVDKFVFEDDFGRNTGVSIKKLYKSLCD